MVSPDKYVKRVEDIPTVEHFALYSQGYELIPGDERSRTHPGHGYPASTSYFIEYLMFLTIEKLQSYLEENEKLNIRSANVAVKITPLKIMTSVSVSISV